VGAAEVVGRYDGRFEGSNDGLRDDGDVVEVAVGYEVVVSANTALNATVWLESAVAVTENEVAVAWNCVTLLAHAANLLKSWVGTRSGGPAAGLMTYLKRL
jgi:hypothetical protein